MTRLTNILELIKRIVVIAALLFLCVFLWEGCKELKQFQIFTANANTAVYDARFLVQNTDTSLNGTAAQRGKDGLLFSVKKGVDDVRAGAVLASRQEVQYYADLKIRTDDILDQGQRTLASLGKTIDAVNASQAAIAADAHKSFGNLDRALLSIPPVLEQGRGTLKSVQETIADPNIQKSVALIASSADHIDQTTANVAAMTSDLQAKVHQATHPSKTRFTFGVLWTLFKIGATRIVP